MKKRIIFSIVLIAIGFSLGMAYSHLNKKVKLDKYYLDTFKVIKSRMINGSSVDSRQDLSNYQDHVELCMHLDGYNGLEIINIRCKALIEVAGEENAR